MSNSVARFIFDNTPCEYTHSAYFLLAYNSDYKVNIVFDTIRDTKLCIDNRITNECVYLELTKDQITHLLSLDCPDAFIAYALTLCPRPPETAKPALVAVDGGILARHELLKESVPVCDCGSTFYRDDLGSCYDCFFPSDDRGE